jgi:hypothetical protein
MLFHLSRGELKIFITLFLIYSFFIYWGGYNENSRLALTRAIVDEGKLEIDSYANLTADRAFYNGHYYSDKIPGTSILAIPPYSISKFLVSSKSFEDNFYIKYVGKNRIPILEPIGLGDMRYLMIIITIFTSSFFGALFSLIFYKLIAKFIINKNSRLFFTTLFCLGTMIFPHSVIFWESVPAIFLSFLAFYILYRKNKKGWLTFLAGVLSGFSIVVSSLAIPLLIIFLIYCILNRKNYILFCIGILIGILPIISYNVTIFGRLTYISFYKDPSIWVIRQRDVSSILKQILINAKSIPFILIRVLFYPFNGLFFYYPIFLLSFSGILKMYKKFKLDVILIISIFLLTLLLTTLTKIQFFGAFFGPRLMSLALPFLALPIACLFNKRKKFWKFVILILFFYSILINFASLQPKIDFLADESLVEIKSEYREKLTSFEILSNPIFDYYLPLFFKHGPRSRIFENLVNNKPLDIRFLFPEDREYFLSFYNYLPFSSLIPILIFLFIVWNREIFEKKSLLVLLISLIFAILAYDFFYLSYTPSQIYLKKGFFPQDPSGKIWIGEESEIILNHKPGHFTFSAVLQSYFENKEVEVYLNGKLLDRIFVKKDYGLNFSFVLNISEEKNILKFKVIEGCKRPAIITDGLEEDSRCLGISFENITFNKTALITFSGFYPSQKELLMEHEGEILVFNPSKNELKAKIKIILNSVNEPRRILIIYNDGIERYVDLDIEDSEIEREIPLSPGINKILLRSIEGCKAYGKDSKYVSIRISNVKVIPTEKIEELRFEFISGWYPQTGEIRWIKNKGSILVFNPSLKQSGIFKINVKSFLFDRKIELFLNRKKVDEFFAFIQGNEIYSKVIELENGWNGIEITSPNCSIVSRVDKRCLSVGIKSIEFLPLTKFKPNQTIFAQNWYFKAKEDDFQWAKNDALIILFYFDVSKNVTLKFDILPFLETKNIEFYLNDEIKNIFRVVKEGGWVYTLPQKLDYGPNYLRFHVKEGCIIIDEILHNEDMRCFSMTIRNITLA